jgi:hypothetical protein
MRVRLDCIGRIVASNCQNALAGDDGKRFVVRADEKFSAFVELEREVLTATFYLQSIRADS